MPNNVSNISIRLIEFRIDNVTSNWFSFSELIGPYNMCRSHEATNQVQQKINMAKQTSYLQNLEGHTPRTPQKGLIQFHRKITAPLLYYNTLNGALSVRNSIPGISRSHMGNPLQYRQESPSEINREALSGDTNVLTPFCYILLLISLFYFFSKIFLGANLSATELLQILF